METNRVFFIQNARAVAIIGVVFLHSSLYLFPQYSNVGLNKWLPSAIYQPFSHFAVPVFLMITGYLVFDKEFTNPKEYYFKRITRILYPFIFWTIVYILYDIINFLMDNREINVSFFVNRLRYGASHQFWYLYMLIPIYFFIPYVAYSMQKLNRVFVLVYLGIWLFFNTVLFMNTFIIVVPSQTGFQNLSYFGGFLGYLILGYYLKNNPLKIGVINSLLFWVVFVVMTIIGTIFLTINSGGAKDVFLKYLNPFVIMGSLFAFSFFQKNIFFNRPNLIMGVIAKYSFGIYFIHVLIFEILRKFGIHVLAFNAWISIPLLTIVNLLISLIILRGLNNISIIKKIIM